jgi:hypothetical protein
MDAPPHAERVPAGRDSSCVASAADEDGQADDNGGMRSSAVLMLVIVVLLIAGCSMVLPQGGPMVAQPGVAPGEPMIFPECQTAELAFAGESTLAALGLDEFASGPDANKVGMIWVTAGPVAMPGPGGPGMPAPVPEGRMVCVQWPDGSGMAGMIADEWVPPAAEAVVGSSEATEGPPTGVLVLVGGAAVLIGASVLAFRREAA